MNNKGQTLVLFVLILPLVIILFIGIIDICNIQYEKRKMENILDNSFEYYKSGKDVDKYLSKLVDDYLIDINNDFITIKVKKEINGLIKKENIELIRKEHIYGT